MPLPSGTRLGPYEIIGWIGAGGMGEVYRARDSRLDRDVAVKLIAGPLAADPDRVRRFEQEARAAGQLTHPNVLSVYDVGTHDGVPYIVSEVVEGESLGDLLQAGPLPPRKAIDYARQIAEGLAAAHDVGIVHRDLKPDNVVVARDGRLKILDFGIAKLVRPSDDADARTTTTAATEPTQVWGTVRYMSPEQVRGEVVDARSDLFSLGTILHEMLTGRPVFARATTADTMAAILKEEPGDPLPSPIDPALARLVGRCLEKPRDARFQSARDLAFGLAQVAEGTASRGRWPLPPRFSRAAALALASVAAGAAIMAWWPRADDQAAAPAMRFELALGADVPLAPIAVQFGNAMALSRDGTTIAFVGQSGDGVTGQIYVRSLSMLQSTPLADTERAVIPFFSPDGKWIAFFAGGKLKAVPVTGGPVVTLADAPEQRGGHWGTDGTIVFSPDRVAGTQVMRVAAQGGVASAVVPLAEGESVQLWPQLLPGDTAVLFTSSVTPGSYNDADLVVQPLAGGPRKVIQRGGFHGVYLATGHIVFIRDATLFALPFDLERLDVTGPPVPVLHGVMANSITGGAQFAVSDTGSLAYLPGSRVGAGTPLAWMTAQGAISPIESGPTNWLNVRFSPDGTRLALERRDEAADIWIYELARGTVTRLTSDAQPNLRPLWSPDGQTIVFAASASTSGPTNLFAQRADGTGPAQRLTESARPQEPGAWHPSGRSLVFLETRPENGMDLMVASIDGSTGSGWTLGAPAAFVEGPAREWDPAFSPDGRWLAYVSNETGRAEIVVRPFPGPGGKWQVSTGGGTTPTWLPGGDGLIYAVDGALLTVALTFDGGTVRASAPRLWSAQRYITRGPNRMFDLHPDGRRLALAPAPVEPAVRRDSVVLILNFFNELRRIAADER